ncbi:YfiR family protein [Novosphingobium sp. RD2P27]|uniref:YfiR family protein n=1 Tax=Novosphingobium kalidii TaxID=3230299 RepID=A0ABV2D3B1_9SPHN
MHLRSTLLALLLAASASFTAARAATNNNSPNDLRAAIVYNIVRFVDFPGSGNRLEMCVARNADGASQMLALRGQRVGNRSISVRMVDSASVGGCDVFYLGHASAAETARARSHGVLLVGDTPSFINSGGTVGLVRMGKQIRFEINARNAQHAGLTISSKLLRLAARVEQ